MFSYTINSFLGASLISDERQRRMHKRYSWPESEKLNTLSSVSALYLYTNPPPMGYGTPAPKVMESVNRAYDFNRKPEGTKTRQVDEYTVNSAYWEDENLPYPFDSITGNWHPGQAHCMYKRMLVENFQAISQIADTVISETMITNSDVLTQGRQTWCPISCKSIPSAQAYMVMADYLKKETGVTSSNCLEWIKSFFDLMGKESVTAFRTEKREFFRTRYNRVEKQKVRTKIIHKIRVSYRTKTREETFRWVIEILRSFCSYIKHGERGKRERRAIASANIGLRMFFHIIEDFHLRLGKILSGSTISIGGEEKKVKITTNLNAATLTSHENNYKLQATQDATKFNECLSSECFAMMHLTFFSDQVRDELMLPRCTPNERLFLKLCLSSHFLLAIKMITLGDTPLCIDLENKACNRPDWVDVGNRLNVKTSSLFEECRHRLVNGMYIEASPGMLMGMHNAASTTLGLASVMHNQDEMTTKVVTLRSSDDSMTVYVANSPDLFPSIIETEKRALQMLGFNISAKKSMIFKRGFGEYNSWYQDGNFVSQYGVETSTMRPQGQNPPDDFHSLAKSCNVSQLRLETNPIGAEAKLQLGVDNIRRLWRIKVNPNKRVGISPKVLALSDGGENLWDCMSCHLEETSLKEHYATTQEEKEYLLKIRNPDNPIISPPEEEITWSKETGSLKLAVTDTPRTIFHTIKRTNRAITNIKGGTTHADIEKANSQVMKIVNEADLSTSITTPSSKTLIADHVKQCIYNQMEDIELDEDEEMLLRDALSRLTDEPADIEYDVEGDF
ncbi:replicase PB1 [Halyomorpha halys orthomyxo-like virus 1]|nr:replicase PB1 [Halyomorpha halys orthomyxo-like virus 1]